MNEIIKKLFPGLIILTLVVVLGLGFYFEQPKANADADTAATSVTVGNAEPTLESLSLNGNSNFNPTPGGVTAVTVSGKLVDDNGCADMTSITGAILLTTTADVGCAFNSETCYSGLSCTTASCSGSVAEVSCGANIYFFANPTDNDAALEWVGVIMVTDSATATVVGDSESEEVEFTGSRCISVVPASIAYGSITAGSDSESTPQSVLVANVCNTDMDTSVAGTNMTSAAATATIYVSEQQFSTETFTYGSNSHTLLVGAGNVDIVSAKPTASPTNSSDEVFWGIGIPGGAANATDYGGVNTFTAIESL